MNFLSNLFRGDKAVWKIYGVLCIISLIEVYSATSTLAYHATSTVGPIIRHATFLLIGTCLIIFFHRIHYKYSSLLGMLALLAALIFLIMAPVMGTRINGTARWVQLFGIQFQPSEFAKLGMVIFSAFILSKSQKSREYLNNAFWILMGATFFLFVFIIRENLSTAILLCVVEFIMMFLGRVSSKKLLSLVVIVVSVSVVVFLLLKFVPADSVKTVVPRWETWQNRLFKKELKVTDTNFRINDRNRQVSYAKMAISNGKYFGTFPGNSSQRDFLPQAYSDFIYAIIIEETGWIGLFVVPLLYLMLLFRSYKIAQKCKKIFPTLLVMGSSFIVVFQAFINMLVAVGAGPVTGQPLPMISRGGTSTIITCVYFAIILSVSNFGEVDEQERKYIKEIEKDKDLNDRVLNTSEEYGV